MPRARRDRAGRTAPAAAVHATPHVRSARTPLGGISAPAPRPEASCSAGPPAGRGEKEGGGGWNSDEPGRVKTRLTARAADRSQHLAKLRDAATTAAILHSAGGAHSAHAQGHRYRRRYSGGPGGTDQAAGGGVPRAA